MCTFGHYRVCRVNMGIEGVYISTCVIQLCMRMFLAMGCAEVIA